VRTLAASVCCAALALAGCGGDDDEGAKIPAAQADSLITQIGQIEDDVNNQRCEGARFHLDELEQRAGQLPRDVSEEVRTNIADAIGDPRRLAADECEGDQTETTEPDTTEETTTEETQTTTETAPPTTTETTPPTTETTPPTVTEEAPPADEGGGVGPPGQGDDG
jgi:hypothetical protein